MSGDSSNPGGSPTPDAEQIKTFRDFLANYNKLSEICFSDCVWDFTNRKVSKKEDSCAMNCAEKYLKMNQRISTRFQVTVEKLF
jgi:import inner membrane translocase subunit TIM9